MKKPLPNIASIQSGVYAKPTLAGTVKYLQSRHFDKDHQFCSDVKSEILFDDKLSKHLLKQGDILIAVKGYDHFAVLYSDQMGQAVASTVFLVIRSVSNNVLPEYLTWYLNHPHVQSYLKTVSKGTNLPSITIADMQEIEVPIPSLETQQNVLQLHDLHQQEITIKRKLEHLHELSLQQQIINAINQS
ncbi:MAG: restriction endonuclease subunit S [Cyclobacteriaceae bacterium]|nr:restriction endonuclease subunit S [Cyclobacteriaceae bacterium]